MFVHKDAKTAWKTLRVRKDSLKAILIVETNMSLDRASPHYDEAKNNALVEAVRKYLKENPDIDEADLVSLNR